MAVAQGDSHLFEVAHHVFGPVDEAHDPPGDLVHVGVVVLGEGQEQSQHPDHTHHHFGLCGWHALLQRVDDGHVPVKGGEEREVSDAGKHLWGEPPFSGSYNLQLRETTALAVPDLSVWNALFPCPVLMLWSYFESSSSSYTINLLLILCWMLCAELFYKHSMEQREVKKLCVHPTWFTHKKDFIVDCYRMLVAYKVTFLINIEHITCPNCTKIVTVLSTLTIHMASVKLINWKVHEICLPHTDRQTYSRWSTELNKHNL